MEWDGGKGREVRMLENLKCHGGWEEEEEESKKDNVVLRQWKRACSAHKYWLFLIVCHANDLLA